MSCFQKKCKIEHWLSFVCLLFQQPAPRLSPEYRKRLESIERQLQTLVDDRERKKEEVSSLRVSSEDYEFKWFLMDDQKCEFDASPPMYALVCKPFAFKHCSVFFGVYFVVLCAVPTASGYPVLLLNLFYLNYKVFFAWCIPYVFKWRRELCVWKNECNLNCDICI